MSNRSQDTTSLVAGMPLLGTSCTHNKQSTLVSTLPSHADATEKEVESLTVDWTLKRYSGLESMMK